MGAFVRSSSAPAVVVALAMSDAPSLADAPLKATPDGRPLTLVFSDDFNTFRRLGTPGGVWRPTYGDGTQKGLDRRSLDTNKELEIYVDRDLADAKGKIGLDPYALHDGVLDLIVKPTPANLKSRLDNYPYVSGLISSQPSFSQLYGYFEMRAKLPAGKGIWPAFWLLPLDLSWPPEIDIMESVGDPTKVYCTVHSKVAPSPDIVATVTPNAFHTYAASWDARNVIWYVDGKKIGQAPTPADMHKPMYLIANVAIGGDWAGTPDHTTVFPAKLSIDYIRAYRFTL
jgi:beta-glucanase (GH16 family)